MGPEEQREMIAEVREAEGVEGGVELSQWEDEFLESIEEVLDEKKELSSGRIEKLEEIHGRLNE